METTKTATEQIKVRVSDLREGDYLPATKRTVIYAEAGARTPRGKTEVKLRRNSGTENVMLWGSDTEVWIVRN